LSVGPSLGESLREQPHSRAVIETSFHGGYGTQIGPRSSTMGDWQATALTEEAHDDMFLHLDRFPNIDITQEPPLDVAVSQLSDSNIPSKDQQFFPHELRLDKSILLPLGWKIPPPNVRTWGGLKDWARSHKEHRLYDTSARTGRRLERPA
jgi:hypothetical protein